MLGLLSGSTCTHSSATRVNFSATSTGKESFNLRSTHFLSFPTTLPSLPSTAAVAASITDVFTKPRVFSSNLNFNGSSPDNSSSITTPKAYTSDFCVATPKALNSGAMYSRTPSNCLDLAGDGELRGAEVANPSVEGRFGDDDSAALDVVMDEVDAQTGFVVNVIEAVSEIRGHLHSRHPRGEHREMRAFLVAEAIGEARPVDEVVDEVDVVAGDGGAEELDDADVVAPADDGEELLELRGLEFAAELALEDNDVGAAEVAAPAGGGGGVALREEVVGGGADFGEVVDVRVFRERVAEGSEGGSARNGCVGGEPVAGGAAVGGAVRGGGFVRERIGP
ncbi:hypothetical protein CR513_30266, partial [Mucuna pruriens]